MILISYEATAKIRMTEIEVETPVAKALGVKFSEPSPVIIPVLRAGLGMLNGLLNLIPVAEVGFLGIKRDESTLEPYTYANRLPNNLKGRQVFIVDPMLATGGTLIDSIKFVLDRGATDITCICLIGTPEGISSLEEAFSSESINVFLGALDSNLNSIGYIVPGLGDAGDRLYGVAG